MPRKFWKVMTLSAGLLSLGACGALDRVASIGQQPELEPIKDVKAPRQAPTIGRTVPQREDEEDYRPNSLWRTNAKAFFKDQRANRIGDILTVEINIQDQAQIGNTTTRTRQSAENVGLDNFFGAETLIPRAFTSQPADGDTTSNDAAVRGAFNPGSLVGAGSDSTYTGNGVVNRTENINMTVAAIVTDVLPNGNLVIQARQEVRVNFEKRILVLAGLIRPEDISARNTIQHTQIAEARIAYGGEGQITDVQQPRYGTQLYDILFPF